MRKGLIHVYTGDGKGKTTSAVGLAVRALSHKLKVGYIYFHKNPKVWGYGELKILKRLGGDVFGIVSRHPCLNKGIDKAEIRKECLKGVDLIKEIFSKKKYDLLVLDEIMISVRDGFLKEAEVLELFNLKPKGLELVLTGRGVKKSIIEKADYVSQINKVKHPFDAKIKRRRGIEY